MFGSDRSQANIPASKTARYGPFLTRSVGAAVVLTILAAPTGEPAAPAADPAATVAGARPLALIENRRVLSYPMDQAWPTAIRYLKVDRGFDVGDHDREAGYMLFSFVLPDARVGSGSLEMFATTDSSGRPSVSVAISTGAGPVHLPNAILDGIAAKLRSERGQPAPPPPPGQDDPPERDDPNDDHSVPLMPPAVDP